VKSVCAQEAPLLELNAHASFGVSRTLANGVAYRAMDSSLVALDDGWSGRLDNRIGVQARWNIAPAWSAVVQSQVRRNGADDVRMATPWAYLSWHPDTQWEVRLGRFRQSLFLITDSYDIGYSHPWVRPPAELYTLVGESTSIDGVQIRHRHALATGLTGTLTAHAGVTEVKRPRYQVRNTRNIGISYAVSNGALTVQAALVSADTRMTSSGIEQVEALIRQQDPAVADDYAVANVSGQNYGGLGLRYEKDGWLFISEIGATQLQRRSMTDRLGWYATLGRTFGAWTPYLSYAENRVTGILTEDRLVAGSAASTANAFLARRNTGQHTWSFGVRWDFQEGMDLKVQLDRVSPDTYGLQATLLPDGRRHFNVLSVVMDWAY
jgi:hypothetical protein